MLLSGLWFELVFLLVPVSSLSMRLVICFVLRHSFSVSAYPAPSVSPLSLSLPPRYIVTSDLSWLPVYMSLLLPSLGSCNDGGALGPRVVCYFKGRSNCLPSTSPKTEREAEKN